MSLNTFKGGVHPIEGKDLSKDKPVKELLPGKELAFPLSQHIGAPARAIVAAGDTVLRGQMIAEAGGFVSAPIYASVSGKVKGIEPRLGAAGAVGDAIIIENDEQYQEVDFTECDEVDYLSKEEIIDKIRTAGVVGMGGAGFPTAVKMSPKNPDEIDTIIANCAECEPFLTSDYRQMMDHPEELVEGMRIILQIFGKARGFFGVENNKPDCIAKLEELVKDEPRMSVIPLKTKYPQGGERQIIYACTGRAINSKMLPADAGCIVDNVATICAIYKAVRFGIPVIDRIFTVSGDAVTEPQNFHIHIGTYMDEILAAAKDVALQGVQEIAPAHAIGLVHHVRAEEERLSTHLFECTLPGYRGWFWFATLSRAPRSRVATICEVGLLPGDDALIAPDWVPWADRVRPEDLEENAAQENAESAETAEVEESAELAENKAEENESAVEETAEAESAE